ncbi:hypothetical protein [uncultured Sulfitobacter sp.]|uniref:hypothetical protein n=1 Tax=uncultured Sulfitobacter sp. TaxID=191468 RepID=UPI002630401E|nr:hypothetical protein [uncultured Sulfitobacter sp.]
MSTFRTIFGWRQQRRPAPHTMKFDVKLLLTDGTIETVTVDIPECTRARDLLSACAVEVYARHNITGELSRIGAITQRPLRHGRDIYLPVEGEAPAHLLGSAAP